MFLCIQICDTYVAIILVNFYFKIEKFQPQIACPEKLERSLTLYHLQEKLPRLLYRCVEWRSFSSMDKQTLLLVPGLVIQKDGTIITEMWKATSRAVNLCSLESWPGANLLSLYPQCLVYCLALSRYSLNIC